MKLKRIFYGKITSTGELVEIRDYRNEIDTTTMNSLMRTSVLGDKPYCRTADGLQVRVKNEKYVDVENLEGEWEIETRDGEWLPIAVSLTPLF